MDVPSGPVVKNPPANAGDTGSTPLLGRWHMHLKAAKSMCHNFWSLYPRAHAQQQEKPSQWETHALQLESSFCLPQLEKACSQQQRPSAANTYINKYFKKLTLKKRIGADKTMTIVQDIKNVRDVRLH